jgi:isoamylase
MDSHLTSVESHDHVAQEKHLSSPYPLGLTVTSDGTNFSVFSANATGMEIVLFDDPDVSEPSRIIHLDPLQGRTSHYGHTFVTEVRPGQLYGYRAKDPHDPSSGQRFDSQKVLLDPYGESVLMVCSLCRISSRVFEVSQWSISEQGTTLP